MRQNPRLFLTEVGFGLLLLKYGSIFLQICLKNARKIYLECKGTQWESVNSQLIPVFFLNGTAQSFKNKMSLLTFAQT